MRQMALDECIWRLGEAAKRGHLQGREKGFAFAMLRLANRGGTPSPKQEKWARALAESLVAEHETLIEEFDPDG